MPREPAGVARCRCDARGGGAGGAHERCERGAGALRRRGAELHGAEVSDGSPTLWVYCTTTRGGGALATGSRRGGNAAPLAMGQLELAFRTKVRMGDIGGVRGMLKAGEVDFSARADTLRQWTPLHIACWGTMKPQNDKDIVEAILLAGMKAGNEEALRNASDALEGLKPVDLAKERRDAISTTGAPGNEADQLDEKRKYDKIIEWLEKGLPAPGS